MVSSTPLRAAAPTPPAATGPLPHVPGRMFARGIEYACALGGMAFALLFAVGFVGIAGFFPPPQPNDSATETLAFYRDNTNAIRAGLLLCYVGCMCFLMFGSGILGQTRRIKGVPPALVYLQLSSYASAVLLIILPLTTWLAVAFRPNTASPESAQLLNDFAWITFVIGFVPFVTWVVSTGLAILCDQSENPIYPRWVGYLSVFMGFIQTTAVLLPFTKAGPFAWNGLFSWYIPFTDFFTWFLVITIVTIKAINRRVDEPAVD